MSNFLHMCGGALGIISLVSLKQLVDIERIRNHDQLVIDPQEKMKFAKNVAEWQKRNLLHRTFTNPIKHD